MKSQALQELVRKIFSDEKTQQQFRKDPDSVLARYDLTEQEKRAILKTHAKLGLVAAGSEQLETILDANITTFIAGLVLYTYGSGPIQGFALTLMIGIVASMFTAIIVTRVIFDYTLEKLTIRKLSI